MLLQVITTTAGRDFTPSKQGKVRDIYDLGDRLLIVATDRLSAFDVVLPDGIPDKGKVLTQVSAFWFDRLAHLVKHHLLSTAIEEFPEPFCSRADLFGGRSMLVTKTAPLPVECVVRGYITGSGWNDYRNSGSICGLRLPAGLQESQRLPEPLFTPTTKADVGVHDESMTFAQVEQRVGSSMAKQLRDVSIQLYSEGAAYAETRGIVIADTKFEFGVDPDGTLVWIDEALTPDSSRFWPLDTYRPGAAQLSFDKQFVRDYLLTLHWDKRPPAPHLPPEVIATTAQKYREALRRLTGRTL
jgi:phosphoribosylaminoimidazole-succinocarboxamide synthase